MQVRRLIRPATEAMRAARSATGAARLLLLLEGATFVAAAAIHAGVLLEGHRHREAAIAESVIAMVLLGAVVLS